jgi:hypothetical protein
MPIKATVEEILAKLDELAAHGNWPRFDSALGTFEYHAMRLVAVTERGGDEDWGLAFECVYGDFLVPVDEHELSPYAANVSTYVIIPKDAYGRRDARGLPLSIRDDDARDGASLSIDGITIDGPAGALACTDAMIADYDLRPGMLCGGCEGGATDSNLILLIRAYLARYPGSLWQDVSAAFGAECDVVVVSDAFEHVVGVGDPDAPNTGPFAVKPSASTTYQSLAEALVAGEPSRFVPGRSNLDWRLHATVKDGNAKR